MNSKIGNYIFGVLLVAFTLYILLDTFVISDVYNVVDNNDLVSDSENDTGSVIRSDNSYDDDNISINIKTYNEYNTSIYVADIVVSDSSHLKTAFANNSYGKNIVAKTSEIADSVNGILAINGDYYGVQENGYVLKNGVIYRSSSKNGQEDLVIYRDGSFEIINESDISINNLLDKGAYNILSFGPGLVSDNKVIVDENAEVGKSMSSNPRTAIGIIDNNHYVFVVSDGRTSESEGLSLYELATFMKNLGCDIAYNLEGGGSSTMYFNGKVINNPTTMGNRIKERSISDIVYIGY